MSFPLRPSRDAMPRSMRTKVAFALGGLIVATAVAAVLLIVFASGQEELLPVGAQAPEFSLHTTSGAVASLEGYRGRVVVLEFCASWSTQCELEAPLLNGVVANTSAALFLINADSEDATSVDAFRGQFHVAFPVLLDPGSKTVTFPAHGPRGAVTAQYRVTELPTVYVLDPNGRVAWRSTGAVPPNVLAREIRRASRSLP